MRPAVGVTVALRGGSPRVLVTEHDPYSENGVWASQGPGEALYWWPDDFEPNSQET